MTEIRSVEAALMEAERMLLSVTSGERWKSSAIYPLAAILLAVAHTNGGHAELAAVYGVASRPVAGSNDSGIPDWRWATQVCPSDQLAEPLRRLSFMAARQRDSIKNVILEAILIGMGDKIVAAMSVRSAHDIDELRHRWIDAHVGTFTFQKRRAALLGKELRGRARAHTGLHLEPHGIRSVPPPLLSRALEVVIVAVAALAAPIGWPVGRLLYRYIAALIPERLRSYPIPALLWAAALCVTPFLLLFSAPASQRPPAFELWLLAQAPATFLAAGIYGILEGWLAVEGSTTWWPPATTVRKSDA